MEWSRRFRSSSRGGDGSLKGWGMVGEIPAPWRRSQISGPLHDIGSTPETWLGMQVAYDLWQARDYADSLEIVRLTLPAT